MQVNYEDYYHKRLMKSKIVNMALMMLSDELSKRDDKKKLEYLKTMETDYRSRFN